MKVLSSSPKETEALGRLLGKEVVENKYVRKNAFVIALYGNLGAGKTRFVKGFAKGVDAKGRIVSPTFVIFRRLPLKKNRAGFKSLVHVDAYRIKKIKELDVLDFKKILTNQENIVIIEWPSNIRKTLKSYLKIYFKHLKKESEREVVFSKIN